MDPRSSSQTPANEEGIETECAAFDGAPPGFIRKLMENPTFRPRSSRDLEREFSAGKNEYPEEDGIPRDLQSIQQPLRESLELPEPLAQELPARPLEGPAPDSVKESASASGEKSGAVAEVEKEAQSAATVMAAEGGEETPTKKPEEKEKKTALCGLSKATRELLWLTGLAVQNVLEMILSTAFWGFVTPFALFVFVAGIHYRVLPPVFPEALFALLDPNVPYYTFCNAFCLLYGGLFCLTELLNPKYLHFTRMAPARFGILLCLLPDIHVVIACNPGPAFWAAGWFFWMLTVLGAVCFVACRFYVLGPFR